MTPIDTLGSVRFKIKNFGITVDGSFSRLQGKIIWDERRPENSFFDISIDASSISTGVALRDKHLQKEEYFYTTKFPVAKFRSTKILVTEQPGLFQVEGELIIKETSRKISFPFKLVVKKNRYVFSGQLNISRRDYGVGGSSFSLSDYASVFLTIIAKK